MKTNSTYLYLKLSLCIKNLYIFFQVIQSIYSTLDNAIGWIGIGILRSCDEESIEESIKFITNGLKQQSLFLEGWVQLASILLDRRLYQGSIECAEKGAKFIEKRQLATGGSYQRISVALQLIIAKAYQRSKKRQNAIQVFNSLLEKDPQNTEVLKGLGELSLEEKRISEALKYFDKILQLDPSNDWAISHQGLAELSLGNLQEAANKMKLALSLNPNQANYHFQLGKIYWQMGGEFRIDKKFAQVSVGKNYLVLILHRLPSYNPPN